MGKDPLLSYLYVDISSPTVCDACLQFESLLCCIELGAVIWHSSCPGSVEIAIAYTAGGPKRLL